MNIRNLVPALAIVTLTSTAGFAADAAPAVTYKGWVDAVVQYTDDDTKNSATTKKNDGSGSLRFTGEASVQAAWKVTDALTTHINVWVDPGNGTDNVNVREAYFNWAFADGLSWTMGKYIDHIGWISTEPTGPNYLFINADTIGYREIYGNDVMGAALNIAPKGSPLSGSVHVTNGYFTGSDGNSHIYSSPNSATRENSDLGFGLDVTYALPNELGSINAELAYDMHSGNTTGFGGVAPQNTAVASGLGGDVLLLGLNATVKPVKILTLGAEIQYLTLGESKNSTGVNQKDGVNRTQGLLLANVVIEKAPANMSVSALVQYVSIDRDLPANAKKEDRVYVGVAVLTNPLVSSNFGLNYEFGYFDKKSINGTNNNDLKGFTLAVEGLISF